MKFKYVDFRGMLLTMTVTIIPIFGLYFVYNLLILIRVTKWSNKERRVFGLCMGVSLLLNIIITDFIIGWFI